MTAVPQAFFYHNNPLVNPSGSTINSLDNLFGTGAPAQAQFTKDTVTPVFGATPGAQLNAHEQIVSPFSAYSPAGFALRYEFSGADGATPQSRLVEGLNHVLYGTTNSGGVNGVGEIFSIVE